MTSSNSYTVLYVDDEPNNLLAFKSAFFRYYTILTANSAAEALQLLAEHPVQLIVTDQRMPQMNGLELLKTVKEQYPDIMRMIVTGYSDLSVVMSAFNDVGIFHYVLKPWNNQELRIIMDNALTKYRLTLENERLIQQLTESNTLLEVRIQERTNELLVKNQELKQLNKLKDKLFSIISHDLRSPIASLMAFTKLYMEEQNFTPEEFATIIGQMNNTLGDLSSMLHNMLSWSREQMNQTPSVLSHFSLQSTMESHLAAYKLSASQKQLSFQIDWPLDPLVVYADADRLSVVLRNLISNAIKFTPVDGVITVKLENNDHEVIVSVEDTGVGISPENIRKLLARQELVSSRGTANEKGTGLGLMLCQEYLADLGSSLHVQSELNKGTRFSFALPLSLTSQLQTVAV
ncbi:hybrid sensor histidine kinase/response regulator [Cytophagaceae bacterium DM2B3-1]|uniref:histidine kinase n=1 Tax=Xanthocytophaga flava TaxID=3048013 RepID=A0ABT7CU80_9BACT|nr:hybrid sensor histidine kinase/response regulator [Xanthocytophaga flavus]MDJ1467934.1 hybrid sensor histidine kinase/response regulator [Xanthocytophaga flavus]MDJ1497061.1 hybrid sensor histidine kinase/response regulator [Xanthocytophaga flavus]